MPVKFGSNKIASIRFGNTKISKVYHGSNLVMSDGSPVILTRYQPILKAWDVTGFADYQDYTLDNFFMKSFDTLNEPETINVTDGPLYIVVTAGFSKFYGGSNGLLRMNASNNGVLSGRTTTVVLAPVISDFEHIDSVYDPITGNEGYLLYLTHPDEYRNFTIDNFVFMPNGQTEVRGWNLENGTYVLETHFQLEKEYNATSGVLTFYALAWGMLNKMRGGASELIDQWSTNIDLGVYLTRTIPM